MYFVLMGDIVGSSGKEGAKLMEDFKAVVASANANFSEQIYSPLTITLGDEFQGVVKDLPSVVCMLFYIDRELIDLTDPFRIRYSLEYGDIDTPINTRNAYGMLGEGLTNARKGLEELKGQRRHYRLKTGKFYTDEMLNGLFELYDSMYSDWSEKDREYLSKFFEKDDYKWVSEKMFRDPSTVWRKRNSLKLNEFNTAKKLIELTATMF